MNNKKIIAIIITPIIVIMLILIGMGIGYLFYGNTLYTSEKIDPFNKQECLEQANSYLNFGDFSKKGLEHQLSISWI